VPEYGVHAMEAGAAARMLGSALGIHFQATSGSDPDWAWKAPGGDGAWVTVGSNRPRWDALGTDFDWMEYYEAQSLRSLVTIRGGGEPSFIVGLNSAVASLFPQVAFINHQPLEDLGAQLASMAGSASVSFRGVRGQLGRLLRHPALRALKRVEIHEQFDLEPSDVEALRACPDWSPVAVVGVGDGPGPSGEEVIHLVATLPAARGVERLVLNWDTYLGGSPEVREREAEVDRIIGRSICRVNPSS
jgi:hypothetical protein